MNDPFNMQLPSSSSNEDLETISRNKLAIILSPQLFEIRLENQRDKGIDLIVEIKKDNKYTNFRFAVQLKSTLSSKQNKDGSFSCTVEVSNINYLLNYGMPTYYIFYEGSSDQFYISPTNEVFGILIEKHKGGEFPETFSIRFSQLLTPHKIEEIYKQTLDYGTLIRRLNTHLNQPQSNGITIDNQNEVYSVEQNIAFIDQFGFSLLNRTDFDQVIEIEQRTHPRTKASPTFNLVCGIAYFQRANLYKAMELLRLAQSEASVFPPDYQAMLKYTLLNAKYLIGIVSRKEFNKELNSLLGREEIGSFLQIEKAYSAFLNSKKNDKNGIKTLYKELNKIITKEKNNRPLRAMAYGQMLSAESKILINDLTMNFVFICGRLHDPVKSKTYQQWLELERIFLTRLDSVLKFAISNQNFMAASNLVSCKIRWNYSKIYLTHLFRCWNKTSFDLTKELDHESIKDLEKLLEKLEAIAKTYEMLQHQENLVMCLSEMYEILDFLKRYDLAKEKAHQMKQLIEKNDLRALKKRYEGLFKGETSHSGFVSYFTQHMTKIRKVAINSGIEETYFFEIVSEKVLDFLESDIKWTIDKFHDFTFPAEKQETSYNHQKVGLEGRETRF